MGVPLASICPRANQASTSNLFHPQHLATDSSNMTEHIIFESSHRESTTVRLGQQPWGRTRTDLHYSETRPVWLVESSIARPRKCGLDNTPGSCSVVRALMFAQIVDEDDYVPIESVYAEPGRKAQPAFPGDPMFVVTARYDHHRPKMASTMSATPKNQLILTLAMQYLFVLRGKGPTAEYIPPFCLSSCAVC
jgi:hypothetical protein